MTRPPAGGADRQPTPGPRHLARPASARSQPGAPTDGRRPVPEYGAALSGAVTGPPPAGAPGTPPGGRPVPGDPGVPDGPYSGNGNRNGAGGAYGRTGPYAGAPFERTPLDEPEPPIDTGESRRVALDEDEPRRRRRRKGRPRSTARTLLEWAAVIGGGVLIAFVVEMFFIQAFWIPSPSMVPTLNVEDRVLVNKLSYRFGDVSRGDVIVFERPRSVAADDGINDLIKRVIAVQGDVIEGRNGLVYVNGERVDESGYLETGTATENLPRLEIPEGHVFVMGDNRANSEDSRVFGPISEDTIVGRAFIRVLPLGDIGWL